MKELIGNENSREQFKNFVEHNQVNKKPMFLILIWPEWVWKTTFLRDFVEENLGDYVKTDLFWVRDCSKVLWKPHSIQVETPDKQKTIQVSENVIYDNKWVRELNDWLQQSSVSWKKIVIIENLQRMTNAAMNAFLKTCEEPLPNRYILATAEHESWILPTIISRAMVVKFSSLSDAQMQEFIDKEYPEITETTKELIGKLAMWSPWNFSEIYDRSQEDWELLNEIKELFSLLKTKWMRVKKIKLLKKLDEKGLLEIFQNALIKEFTEEWNIKWVDTRIRVKQLVSANVSKENALRDWILAMDE